MICTYSNIQHRWCTPSCRLPQRSAQIRQLSLSICSVFSHFTSQLLFIGSSNSKYKYLSLRKHSTERTRQCWMVPQSKLHAHCKNRVVILTHIGLRQLQQRMQFNKITLLRETQLFGGHGGSNRLCVLNWPFEIGVICV